MIASASGTSSAALVMTSLDPTAMSTAATAAWRPSAIVRRPRGMPRCYCGTARRAPSVAPVAVRPLRRRVLITAGLAEGSALDALLERVAEPRRAAVLAAQPVADLLTIQLALLVEEVLDQRDLTAQPPLVLVDVLAGRAGERRVRSAHRSPLELSMLSPRAKRPCSRY